MGTFEWAGHTFSPWELPTTAASVVARLAKDDREEQLSSILDLAQAAGIEPADVIDALWDTDGDPDLLDFAAGVLRVGTARPWKSTVGLCISTTKQWSTIRGRLIDKGIPNPLDMLPSLTALLDVVEVMVLDSFEKKEDRERWHRDLYKSETTVDAATPPPGWSDGVEGMDDLAGLE